MIKRLMCIVSGMNAGGAETFLMKVYRNLDRTKYQMDFCVNSEKNLYADEIYSMGGKIFIIPTKSKHPVTSFMKLRSIVKENCYQYVIRVNEHSLSTIDLIAAKMGGAKNLIMRSSNASSGSTVKVFLHKMFRFLPQKIPTVKIAPSKKAAEYTFGKKCIEQRKAFIIHNGLDLDEFSFDDSKRRSKRAELEIQNQFVVGHVGRFSKQKNHDFIVDVFYEIQKEKNNAVLLLVGDGELKQTIEQKAKSLQIADKVLFLGVRSDVSSLLNAMDIFLFPSLYEGMPNTVIEAQANGLPCIVSDTITQEVELTDIIQRVSLNLSDVDWKNNCLTLYKKTANNNIRASYCRKMKDNGYDICDCTQTFCNLVFQ